MKKNSSILLMTLLLAGISHFESPAQSGNSQPGTDPRKWPFPIPARIKDGTNPDLFVMTLGDVKTPLADGIFDPVKDEVRLNDGKIIKNYYRDTLGVEFYRPMDKTIFPLPPSGFCTWYYYYQHINETEVKLNAKWIADNLMDYGATVVQVDDGWQALRANGGKGSRDWTGFDPTFPAGMAGLAKYISSLGLTPGIWIAPHGQSNEEVVSKLPGVFILKPDGTSASKTWEGDWLVDPTSPQGKDYLKNLFEEMRGWGYEYYKIDGQPIVVNEFRNNSQYMHKPGGDAEELYRETLDIMREAIGDESYLLGCWGLPIEGVGIMNGSRTGGDVVLGWRGGFDVALRPTMQSYYLHNIAWYTDPDVMMLRAPLTLEQARAWATLQGLTGQALLMSDRLPDLSSEKVELMKRVYPAVDIRPLDLFPSPVNKKVWDLKVNHLGRDYDVVGLFNFGEEKNETIVLNWKELGITASERVHVYDFWNKEYLGAFENGMSLSISPTSCRVLTLVPVSGETTLISTNRHITQGWIDLVFYSFSKSAMKATGKSNIIKNDTYELTFAFPPGEYLEIASVTAMSGKKKLPVSFTNHQGWAVARITSATTTAVDWSVTFKPAYSYRYDPREPANIQVTRDGLNGAIISWSAQYYLNSGYQVFLDGKSLGYTGETRFPLRNLDPSKSYTADVRTVWDDGTLNKRAAAQGGQTPGVAFTLASLLPAKISFSEVTPLPAGNVQKRSARLGGSLYDNCLVVRQGTTDFNLSGLFTGMSAAIAVEDQVVRQGQQPQEISYELVIIADGVEVYKSDPIKPGDKPAEIDVPLDKPNNLTIRVSGGQPGGTGRARGGAGIVFINPLLSR
ncbi:MAG: alpha-galactosidase [Bacteroidales bacterium]|nr:alpha-galactosidase [Bacteroidales bacterium]